MTLRKNPKLEKIRHGRIGKHSKKESHKIKLRSKKKENTYPEDNPDYFEPYFDKWLEGKRVTSYEEFMKEFKEYMEDSGMPTEKMDEDNLIPLYKLMKDGIIQDIMIQRKVSFSEAERIYKIPLEIGKVKEGITIIGYVKGEKVNVRQTSNKK